MRTVAHWLSAKYSDPALARPSLSSSLSTAAFTACNVATQVPTCFAQWWRKGGSQHPFLHGLILRNSSRVACLPHKFGTGHPTQGWAVQGARKQRATPQDWPTGVLSCLCWEASWRQSDTGFMSNQPSVMFKTWSTFHSVPQQAASALPLPLGSPVAQGCSSSIAARLQGTTYWKRCCASRMGAEEK